MNLWLAELGQVALIATFVWSVFGALCKNITHWAKKHFLLITTAIVFLGYCFLINDFSVRYVYQNSHSLLPWYYRICAIWGAHEGSWLLWSWILSLYTFIYINFMATNLPADFLKLVERNVAFVMAAFTGFMLFTSNPFVRMIPLIQTQGHDLNPLLQDPGMIAHPPLLYSGYVGFVLVFSTAIAALGMKQYSDFWQESAALLAKTAWVFLTSGIVLGSWWAYRELGWGGFWAWDPVENAALLPWLTGTALIHLLSKKQEHQRFMLFLFAAACFFLSILGTFLLRSGLVISVHAFAQDPTRGLVLLSLLALIICVCFLYLYKNRSKFHFASKFCLTKAQAWLFAIAAFTVLLGTLYPLISQVIWHENLSVGAPYFNKMLLPILICILGLMAFVVWPKINFKVTSAILAVLFLFKVPIYIISLVLIIFVAIITLLKFSQRRLGFLIAHFGFFVMLIGAIVASNFTSSNTSYMKVGDEIKLKDDISVRLDSVTQENFSNYTSYMGHFKVNGMPLLSEERFYSARSMSLPKVGIITTALGSDIYIAFGHRNDSWVIRSYFRPLVRWVWYGGILMVLGAFISFWRRKYAY